MPDRYDVAEIVSGARHAMERAVPDAVAELLLAQLPHLGASDGVALVRRITTVFPPEAWTPLLADDALERWPAPVADLLMEAVRGLPRGRPRIEAFCRLAKRLRPAEQREALDGIFDGTLPPSDRMRITNQGTIRGLVKTLPGGLQEEWVAWEAGRHVHRTEADREISARNAIGRWPESACRALWARLQDPPKREVPGVDSWLTPHLPHDLKILALERIRACPRADVRRRHLDHLDEELTDAERLDVVENPWNDHTRHDESAIRFHLWRVARHLSRVPMAARQRWLVVALAMQEAHFREQALVTLLPHLEGADRRAASDAIVAAVMENDGFFGATNRWDLFAPAQLPALVVHHALEEGGGWQAEDLVAHVIGARPADVAERCFRPVLELLPTMLPERHLEVLTNLAPWLAATSAGAFPGALSAVDLPPFAKGPDRFYRSDRMYRFGR